MVESAPDQSVLRAADDALPQLPSPSSSSPHGDNPADISAGDEGISSLSVSTSSNMEIVATSTVMADLGLPQPMVRHARQPSPSRTAVEAMYKRLPRFYRGHKEHRTQWDHPLLTKIFEEDIASYNDVKYAAYRTALKFRAISNRLQLHQIKLSTIRSVLKQHGYEAVYQNQTKLPCVELETLTADIYLSARREFPTIEQPELNADLLLSLLLKLYDPDRCGCIKLISAKIGLALLASGSYLEKWKYILSELLDYSRCLSRKNAVNLLFDVARIPEVLGEKRLFGTHLVPAAVDSLWIRGRPTSLGLPEDGFRHWLKDEPQTLVWLSTSYRIRQAERLRHFVKCSICKAYPITGLRYRCLRCYNYNMCQSCFFNGKSSKSHRLRHPIREYSTLVSAGQETKDLIKIMKNRVLKGEDYEQKPRYMPILPDSVSALDGGVDSEPETDNRSRSTAPSHNLSVGTPSGSVGAVNKKDFEVDVEVISELDSSHGGLASRMERSITNIPRSISEPVDGNTRFALLGPKVLNDEVVLEEPDVVIQTQAKTKREISVVTAQIVNYTEVNVLLPKLKIVPLGNGTSNTGANNKVNYSQIQVTKPPLITRGTHTDDTGSQTDPQFSTLDYIDASPRGEQQSIQHNRSQSGHFYPRVVNQSSVHIHADMEERRPIKGTDDNSKKFNGARRDNRLIRDQLEVFDRFAESSSPSPELLNGHRHQTEPQASSQSRDAVFENQLEQLERMLVDNLGPRSTNGWSAAQHQQEVASPVWKIQKRPLAEEKKRPLPPPRNYTTVARAESFNDGIQHRTDSSLPPFPVDKIQKATSDPNTPQRRQPPPSPQRVNPSSPSIREPNGTAYHPILDELEEKLRSLNAPLSQKDMRHPFWHHLKEKFEYVLGQSSKPITSHTYQSYGRIDKDYAHTPASYGRNIAHNSNLDVSDGLLPGITQPSPNESQSSGFSSGRETDLKWEEDSYHGPPVTSRLSASTNYRAMPRSKSLGISSHRQVNEDMAQLDKLLEWLDEFKKSS